MSVIKEILKQMNDNVGDSIYLRDIALLMEENDSLRETIDKLEKDLKSCKSDFTSYQKISGKCVAQINKLKKELKEFKKTWGKK